MNAPELENKITISWQLLLGIVVITFTLGGTVTKVLSQEHDIEAVRDYVEQEVGGLRADWERQYRTDVNPRIEKLENKHP